VTAVGHPMVPAVARVAGVQRETADTWTLALEPPGERRRWDYGAGQFNMLYAFGVGEVPISISGSTPDGARLLHTVRAVGRVSGALVRLKRGEAVGVRGPYGSAWPLEEAAGCDVLVAAGGLGLAPVRPVLRALLARRERYGKVILLYGARRPEEILYRREIEAWRARLDCDVEVTVDHAGGAWRGHVGVVTTLVRRAAFDAQNTVAMLCGPEVMMRFTVAALRDAGLARERVYLSMERNMKCALGHCGHCQFGSDFVCKDGPVLRYDRVRERLAVREV
jgi:NAD(P)H-flavin reductase